MMDAYEMAKAAGVLVDLAETYQRLDEAQQASGRLMAEVERLKVERDEAWSAANSAEAKLVEVTANRADLQAEVERLKGLATRLDHERWANGWGRKEL